MSHPDEDVEYLDSYAHAQGLQSRSAALQKAVRRLLRASERGAAYEEAWTEWGTAMMRMSGRRRPPTVLPDAPRRTAMGPALPGPELAALDGALRLHLAR